MRCGVIGGQAGKTSRSAAAVPRVDAPIVELLVLPLLLHRCDPPCKRSEFLKSAGQAPHLCFEALDPFRVGERCLAARRGGALELFVYQGNLRVSVVVAAARRLPHIVIHEYGASMEARRSIFEYPFDRIVGLGTILTGLTDGK